MHIPILFPCRVGGMEKKEQNCQEMGKFPLKFAMGKEERW